MGAEVWRERGSGAPSGGEELYACVYVRSVGSVGWGDAERGVACQRLLSTTTLGVCAPIPYAGLVDHSARFEFSQRSLYLGYSYGVN